MMHYKSLAQQMNELEIDPVQLEKALELAGGDTRQLSLFLSQSLKTFINKAKLEAAGYKETLFRLNRHEEVKKVFARKVAQLEIKNDENAHLNDPNFCGIIYPSTLVEVFLTVKGNLLVQKSVARVLHYCNGQVIRDYTLSASHCTTAGCEEVETPRIVSLSVHSSLETLRREIPDSLYPTVAGAYHSRKDQRFREELDSDFYEEIEL